MIKFNIFHTKKGEKTNLQMQTWIDLAYLDLDFFGFEQFLFLSSNGTTIHLLDEKKVIRCLNSSNKTVVNKYKKKGIGIIVEPFYFKGGEILILENLGDIRILGRNLRVKGYHDIKLAEMSRIVSAAISPETKIDPNPDDKEKDVNWYEKHLLIHTDTKAGSSSFYWVKITIKKKFEIDITREELDKVKEFLENENRQDGEKVKFKIENVCQMMLYDESEKIEMKGFEFFGFREKNPVFVGIDYGKETTMVRGFYLDLKEKKIKKLGEDTELCGTFGASGKLRRINGGMISAKTIFGTGTVGVRKITLG